MTSSTQRGKHIDAQQVKRGIKRLMRHMPAKLPPMSWFFNDIAPDNAFMPPKNIWTCMFEHIEKVCNGKPMCFASGQSGCSGASCYLGFTSPSTQAGRFLAEKEHFKKSTELGNAFYNDIQARPPETRFLIWQSLADMNNHTPVEVITIWTDGAGLAGLVTLANYDRVTNKNVIIPFAAGCQSIWTIPYKEKFMGEPKAVVGGMDPAMRQHLASDTVSFSVSAERFVEMTDNIPGSFLDHKNGN